jgi:Ca2+-binding EF-hand superfamily protein
MVSWSTNAQSIWKKKINIFVYFMERMEVDEEMDEEELAEWRTIFNLFDVDGDESITGEVKVHHLKIIPIHIISYLTLHSYRCSHI